LAILPGRSQTLFQFQYELPNTDTTRYQAFTMLSGIGQGFARIRYYTAGASQPNITAVELEEVFWTNADGEVDETIKGYIAKQPVAMVGAIPEVFPMPVFWFKQDDLGLLQPWGTTTAFDPNAPPSPTRFLEAEILDPSNLRKSMVLQYFNRRDSVYQRLFEGVSRGPAQTVDATMHLIIVANVNEPKIGPSTDKDKDLVLATMTSLAGEMKVKTNQIIIAGANYSKATVLKSIQNLKPGKNDIIFFYYSGHGFKQPTAEIGNPANFSNFPFLDLRPNENLDFDTYALGIDSVYRMLLRKGARCNIILGDCCNNDPNNTNVVAKPPGETRGPVMPRNMRNMELLFLQPGNVLATAANVTERASSNNDFGGFFTYFFKAALNFYVSPMRLQPPTWNELLQNARTETYKKARRTYCDKPNIPANICNQTPIFRLQ
jgi:hypothetical protein